VTGIYDKGSGALVTSEARAIAPETGELMITSRSAVFIRGEGGFGGDRGPRDEWAEPGRVPDHKVTYATRPEQALLYRLSGDRNPLHSDPAFAARAGFDRPILHGLCTYGVAGRALLHAVAGSDPARFASMSGRFSSPVFPGESLTVSIWADGDTALFRVAKDDGVVVIDRGRATFRD
jgi:acyl dehydratase